MRTTTVLQSPGPGRRVTPLAGVSPERGWDLLLVCVAGYIATAVGRFNGLFPILLPLRPALVSAAAAIVLAFAHQAGMRRFGLLRDRTTLCTLLLLAWATLSIPGALNRGVAFFFVGGLLLKTVLLYLLIVTSVRSVRDVERLAFVYFGAASIYAGVVLTRFNYASGDWRLGLLYYYDPNDFATLAVTAIPLGLYGLSSGRLWRRLACTLGLAALSLSFVRCGSRGGFLAIVAVSLYMLFRFSAIRVPWRVLGTAVIAATLVATASDRYWTQMQTILKSDQDYNRTSENGRLAVWRRGVGYMFEHPLLGVGANNFPVAEGTISPLAWRQQYNIGVPRNAPHNSFIEVGAELGVPGLALLVAMMASALGALRAVARLRPAAAPCSRAPPRLAQAFTASLIGFVVGAFFLSLAYHEMLYSLIGLAVGLRKVTLSSAAPAGGSRPTGVRAAVRRARLGGPPVPEAR